MSNLTSVMPPFTLESLVAEGQWEALQNSGRKKIQAKAGATKTAEQAHEVPAETPKTTI